MKFIRWCLLTLLALAWLTFVVWLFIAIVRWTEPSRARHV